MELDLQTIVARMTPAQRAHCSQVNLGYLSTLPVGRPDVAIKVTREHDDDAVWDMEQPNDDDFVAFFYTVTAMCIRNGVLYTGEAHLGGCWEHDFDGYMNGYLPQKVKEAVDALEKVTPHG